jgi:hypothetical protein
MLEVFSGSIIWISCHKPGRIDLAGGATLGVAVLLNISQPAPSATSFANVPADGGHRCPTDPAAATITSPSFRTCHNGRSTPALRLVTWFTLVVDS